MHFGLAWPKLFSYLAKYAVPFDNTPLMFKMKKDDKYQKVFRSDCIILYILLNSHGIPIPSSLLDILPHQT